MRFSVRNGWIADSPADKLEADERPHPARLVYRVLGREEIQALLDACLPAYRTLIATALYTGMRHSELLGLIWHEVDLRGGVVHVRAQLSRARSGTADPLYRLILPDVCGISVFAPLRGYGGIRRDWAGFGQRARAAALLGLTADAASST
jgi:integrase